MRYCLRGHTICLTGLVLLVFVGVSSTTHAATVTWTGAEPSAGWSVGANWDVGVPTAGADIVFPVTSHTTSTNDLTAISLNSIQFSGSGYNVTGNPITVNSITTSNASGQNQIGANLSSNSLSITVNAGTTLVLSGFINGGTPNTTTVTKDGGGTLTLSSPSTNAQASGWAGSIEVKAGTLQLGGSNQIPDRSSLTIDAGATFDLQGFSEAIDGLSGAGAVIRSNSTDPTPIFSVGNSNSSTTFSGTLAGVSKFQKVGTGTLTMSGNSSFTGVAVCEGGALVINGQMLAETSAKGSGTVAGTGPIGAFNDLGGTLRPGTLVATGILNAQSVDYTQFGSLAVHLKGTTAGSGYDQLKVSGAINLTNGTLAVSLDFASSAGDSFTIISNTSNAAITGTFSGLSEGASFSTTTGQFKITYLGGAGGHDVVLTNQSSLVNGVVSDASGNPLPGVTVGDSNHSVTTGADGSYAINVPDGTVTLTATLTAYQFTPPSQTFTATGAPINGVNFTGAPITVIASGTITDGNGNGVFGVTVSDGTRSAVSAVDGTYSITGIPFGTYTLSPSLPGGAVFQPGTIGIQVQSADNFPGQNFMLVSANQPLPQPGNPANPPPTADPNDLDGDGFPNWVEIAAGTNPNDPNSTPFSGRPAGTPVALTLTKMQVQLAFNRTNHDAITFSGNLPVPSGFSPTGQQVIVDVNNGLVAVFSLDKNGNSTPRGTNSFKLNKARKGQTQAAFTGKLTGSIASFLALAGLTGNADAKNKPVSIPVTIYFDMTKFTTTKTLTFTAKKGKTGLARLSLHQP